MHNGCTLGGGELRRSKQRRFWTTQTQSGDFLQFVKMGSDPRIRMSFFRKLIRKAVHSVSRVGSALDLAFDVVALAEEREPVVEHLLVLV